MRSSARQLHSIFLVRILPRTPSLFTVSDAQVDQQRQKHKADDRKDGSDDRIRFFAAQTVEAFWMDT